MAVDILDCLVNPKLSSPSKKLGSCGHTPNKSQGAVLSPLLTQFSGRWCRGIPTANKYAPPQIPCRERRKENMSIIGNQRYSNSVPGLFCILERKALFPGCKKAGMSECIQITSALCFRASRKLTSRFPYVLSAAKFCWVRRVGGYLNRGWGGGVFVWYANLQSHRI